jgi:hypothetical protein
MLSLNFQTQNITQLTKTLASLLKIMSIKRGVGQPPKAANLKKMPVSIKLPQWLIDWTNEQTQSRAVLIEQALCKVHKLKPPA